MRQTIVSMLESVPKQLNNCLESLMLTFKSAAVHVGMWKWINQLKPNHISIVLVENTILLFGGNNNFGILVKSTIFTIWRKTRFCSFGRKNNFVILAAKHDFTILTGNSILQFWRKNSNFSVLGKQDFAILTEKLDFTVLAGKDNFTNLAGTQFCGFGGKIRFCIVSKKTRFCGFDGKIRLWRFLRENSILWFWREKMI